MQKPKPYPGFSEDVSQLLANLDGLGFFDSPESARDLIDEAPDNVKSCLEAIFDAAIEIADFASFEEENKDENEDDEDSGGTYYLSW